jgi:hypothetical protein
MVFCRGIGVCGALSFDCAELVQEMKVRPAKATAVHNNCEALFLIMVRSTSMAQIDQEAPGRNDRFAMDQLSTKSSLATID